MEAHKMLKPTGQPALQRPGMRPVNVTRTRNMRPCRAAAAEGDAQAATKPKTFTVYLKTTRPGGMVFAQGGGASAPVYVDEVSPGGQAEQAGVQKGDVLLRCSAMILKNGMEGKMEQEGYGQRLYNNWEQVPFDCRNQEFKAVMSALKSNSSRMGIQQLWMTFQRG